MQVLDQESESSLRKSSEDRIANNREKWTSRESVFRTFVKDKTTSKECKINKGKVKKTHLLKLKDRLKGREVPGGKRNQTRFKKNTRREA
jgi:hypothetical protein